MFDQKGESAVALVTPIFDLEKPQANVLFHPQKNQQGDNPGDPVNHEFPNSVRKSVHVIFLSAILPILKEVEVYESVQTDPRHIR